MRRRALRDEPLYFELNPRRTSRQGQLLPPLDVPNLDPAAVLPQSLLRAPVEDFPDLGEHEVVQHFHRLSQLNYAVDEGLYPLGSCTMKYNPRINERTARLAGFADLHPLQPDDQVQGALALMWELEQALKAVTGMAGVTLQPAAGAHGELTGILMIRKALEARGDARSIVLVPRRADGRLAPSVAPGLGEIGACLCVSNNPSTFVAFPVFHHHGLLSNNASSLPTTNPGALTHSTVTSDR